jgi:hypothetical protein
MPVGVPHLSISAAKSGADCPLNETVFQQSPSLVFDFGYALFGVVFVTSGCITIGAADSFGSSYASSGALEADALATGVALEVVVAVLDAFVVVGLVAVDPPPHAAQTIPITPTNVSSLMAEDRTKLRVVKARG